MNRRTLLAAALLASLSACVADTGQSTVTLPISAEGTAPAPFVADGWTVTLSKAELAFGAAYFCATAAADARLCETSVVEYLGSTTIDVLDPMAQPLGELDGVTGTVRTASYDLGISYFLTEPEAHPTAGAIDGHSARLEGRAVLGASAFDFVANVDVVPLAAGRNAIVGERTSVTIANDGVALIVRADASAWLDDVDFDALYAASAGGTQVVVIEPGAPAHDAIVLALTALHPPTFEWTNP